jgi:hypothetical protein
MWGMFGRSRWSSTSVPGWALHNSSLSKSSQTNRSCAQEESRQPKEHQWSKVMPCRLPIACQGAPHRHEVNGRDKEN